MLEIIGVTITFGRTRPHLLLPFDRWGLELLRRSTHPALRVPLRGGDFPPHHSEDGISCRPQLKGAMLYESHFQRRYSDRR